MEVIEHHTRQRTEAAAPRPRRLTDRFERLLDRRGVSTAIMAAALLLTALAWFAARDFADNEARQRFERRSDDVHRRIATRMAAYEALLHSAAGLLAAQPETDRASWARYIATLAPDQHLPGVQGVGVARLLQEGELDGFERAVRAEGFADFRVRPEGHDAGERSSIVYLEPLAGRNLRAFGFDMLSEPVRREAMLRARDGRQIALSGTVTLMQEDGQDLQQGLLMYLPVFRNTGAQGERHWGWVYAAFRVHDLMVGILGRESPDIDFSVRDAAEDAAFFATAGTETAPPTARHSSTDRLLRTLEVAGRHWTIAYADRSGPGGADTRGANLVALCGLATDVLLFWSLRNSRRRRAQAERQAAARSDEARTRLSWLTAVSGLSPDAILVFACTQTERRRSAAEAEGAELRLVFSNPAFSEWFGLRPEDLEGLSEPAVAEWLDGLAQGREEIRAASQELAALLRQQVDGCRQ